MTTDTFPDLDFAMMAIADKVSRHISSALAHLVRAPLGDRSWTTQN